MVIPSPFDPEHIKQYYTVVGGEMAWANDDLVLYHGTDSAQVKSILGGLRLSCCRKDTDFRRGFYTTTSEHQAAMGEHKAR